ncbi:hypothetical protein CANCADRAFT_13337, partial [Tortispora caseinolytica NRRL Y-17796]
FEDGVYSCDTFPSEIEGLVPVTWAVGSGADQQSTGGWSGVQNYQGSTLYSYACQAGYLKTQWPSAQGSTGESFGGLQCVNGKLYRTNTATNYLCTKGVGTVYIRSEIGQSVAACRTDYPGTENMDIPTVVRAGQSMPLAVVDSNDYFEWQGMKTSAQYYVNNAGVSVEDGCQWGSASSGTGNWAPLVFGTSFDGTFSYASLIPNPNNQSPANFNVKIVATEGSTINGNCYYENGVFSGGANGCTVTITSGTAEYVLY